MQANTRLGRNQLVDQVQAVLCLTTKKEAEHVLNAVVASLELVLLENLDLEGFTIKLGGFGKFSVRHKPSILRRIPFTGEIKQIPAKRKVKFVSLGVLRQRASVGGHA